MSNLLYKDKSNEKSHTSVIFNSLEKEAAILYKKVIDYCSFISYLDAFLVVRKEITREEYDSCVAQFNHGVRPVINIFYNVLCPIDEEKEFVRTYLEWNS